MKKIIKYLLVLSLLIGYIPQMEQKIKASTNELKGLNLSILGASISTYAGTSNGIAADTTNSTIRNNAKYYPHNVVSDVRLEDTYWMQLADDFGLNLLVNNSWSGSSLLHTRSGTVGAYVNRCLQLHDDTGANAGEEPDIIGIQMGFNDFQYYKDTLGNADIHYEELIIEENGLFTYGTPKTTLEAAAIMLHKIKVRYPNVELYYLNISDFVSLDETSEKLLLDYNKNLEIVCDYFDVTVVDIYNAIPKETFNNYIGDNKVHPNRLGMDCYTEAFKKAILENTKYHVDTHLVSFDLNGVFIDYGTDKYVVDNDSFEVNLTTNNNDSLNVRVLMGDIDITSKVYSNGKISIDKVTDNVRIIAQSLHTPQNYLFDGTNNGLVCFNNELTLKSGTVSNGQYTEVSYQLENNVVLKHDKNWIVEWKSSGSNANGGTGVRLFSSKYVTTENNSQFIFKGNKSGLIFIGERVNGKSHNYGIELNDYGIDTSLEHTYRLVNKIHDDGSNMVYLYVDGNYIGPMDNYYIGSSDNQNKKSDWLNGKDLSFSYIGSNSHGFSNCEMDYIHVFEDTEILTMKYDDHLDITDKQVEILDAGTPTSYQVGYGVEENSVFDTSVVKIENNQLIASGIGEAIVKIDGIVHKITVTSAPISLLLLLGQSNMQGSEGDANQSIICPDGMVYATYGDRYTMNTSNATLFAPSALTGDYSKLNVKGTNEYLSGYPVTNLTASGAGKPGPDSGFAYEWVQATGEKVWVVNAAHGGSSITTWQENGENYKEAMQLFNACQETLRKEIHAGHYTLSHMGYYWLQGCTDSEETASWYVEKYLAMHNNLKTNSTFDHDLNPNTEEITFEFGNNILVMAGHDFRIGYRKGTYTDTSSTFYSTFKELEMRGPRVAQLWMANNKELSDIHVISNIGDSWLTMPDGSDLVEEYFQEHYPNGRVDYEVQVTQKESFYTPTKAKDVKDTIHYNQIGYNEIGIDAARNTCIMLGYLEDNKQVNVKFVDWTGYQEVSEIKASTVGNTNTLVVPLISPIYKSKEIEFEVSEGLNYNYYDLLSNTPFTAGTLKVKDTNQTVTVNSKDLENYRFDLMNGQLVSTGENKNQLTLVTGKIENDLFTNIHYKLEDEIYLNHDIEWILEWKLNNWSTTGSMLLSTTKSTTTKEPYIYINPNYHFVGFGAYNGSNHINYGYQLNKYGIDVTNGPHIYRLVNKIENDSNMIYLFVDGKEIGPMTHNYKGSTTYLGESDWVIGKDFSFSYIGSSNYPLTSMTLEYLIASEKNTDIDIHFHEFDEWELVVKPSATSKAIYKRTCKTCNQTETKEVESIWQKYDFVNHVSELPENVCAGLNLWNVLPHDKEYFMSGSQWGIHSSGSVTSVTFAVQPGDKIFASSFGKAGTNGTNANGIRMTYFTDYDVLKTLSPSQVYEEFSKNGYMIVPEGATYINIPMWSDSSEWKIYILNKEHHYTSKVVEPTCAQGYTIYTCDICAHSYKDNFVDGIGHTFTDYMSNHDALPDKDGTKTAKCNTCDETNTIVDVGSSLGYEIFEGKIISVLGDSISTFAGYVPEADGFNLFHHSRYPQDNLFNEVEKTYWMQMINRMNAKLGINDSWRSTTVQNTYTQEQAGTFYGTKTAMSTLTRIQNLGSNGTPDIILFYGGTNDIARNMKLVEFDENNAPTLNLVDNVWDSFTEAYCQTLLRMKHYYPNSQIIAMLPTYTKTYYPNERLAQYNAVMKDICEYYDVTYIDLREVVPSASYLPDGIHPGEEGMTLIANATMKLLLNTSEFEKGNHKTYQITHQLTSATASKGYYKAVDANSTFTETITGIGLSVQVKMNGVDITDTCVVGNTITIEKVTGNIEIIAKAIYDFGNHLQTFPNHICSNSNIWNLLEHDKQYYTVSGWGTHSSGTVTSVTFNVQANDKIYASSFGSVSTNGGTGNGIRVTYFNENGVVKSMTSSEVYNEFTKNGYLTVPNGVSVINIPMWIISNENEIYILNKEHSFTNYVSNYDGTKTSKCDYCDETNTISDDYLLGDVNNDSKVNQLDRLVLSRHLAKWNGYESINPKNADVNLDGKVNQLDRVILSRYLAKWQGYETLPQ